MALFLTVYGEILGCAADVLWSVRKFRLGAHRQSMLELDELSVLRLLLKISIPQHLHSRLTEIIILFSCYANDLSSLITKERTIFVKSNF